MEYTTRERMSEDMGIDVKTFMKKLGVMDICGGKNNNFSSNGHLWWCLF